MNRERSWGFIAVFLLLITIAVILYFTMIMTISLDEREWQTLGGMIIFCAIVYAMLFPVMYYLPRGRSFPILSRILSVFRKQGPGDGTHPPPVATYGTPPQGLLAPTPQPQPMPLAQGSAYMGPAPPGPGAAGPAWPYLGGQSPPVGAQGPPAGVHSIGPQGLATPALPAPVGELGHPAQPGPVGTASEIPFDLPRPKPLLIAFIATTIVGVILLSLGGGFFIIAMVFVFFSVSLPPLIWLSYINHRGKRAPLPRKVLLIALAGGMLSTVSALIASTLVTIGNDPVTDLLAAPFIEELCKGIMLLQVLWAINDRYSGFMYGVAIGMGFAVAENFLYGLEDLFGGSGVGWGALSLFRGLSGTVGHGLYTGIVGYALGAYLDPKGDGSRWPLFGGYLVAMGLHLSWNANADLSPGFWGTPIMIVLLIVDIYILLRLLRHTEALGDIYAPGGRSRTASTMARLPEAAPRPVPYPQPYGVPAYTVPAGQPLHAQQPAPPMMAPAATPAQAPPMVLPAPSMDVGQRAGAMGVCIFCGTPFSSDSNFCGSCGRPLGHDVR